MATSAVSIIVRTLNFAPRMRPTLLDTPAALLRVPQCQFNFLFRLGFRRIAEPASSTNMSGQDLYELICGTCHDTGVNGAPITGNPADWAHRSPLWQAVLMEHAEEGFLNMPAKGGHAEFPDEEIDAAVLYMPGITFPERPAE